MDSYHDWEERPNEDSILSIVSGGYYGWLNPYGLFSIDYRYINGAYVSSRLSLA